MITCDFFGRIGNNMFQYAMARLMAIRNLLILRTEWNHNDFIEATTLFYQQIDLCNGKEVRLVDREQSHLEDDHKGENVQLHGFFQDARFYNKDRDLIRGFWRLPVYQKNKEDIVIHLRLTDYWWRFNDCVISPEWYFKILAKEKFKRLFIVVEPHITNKKYLSYFNQYRPIIVSKSPKEDFEFLMSFDRIVCSNSTFAWWSAFLSQASKIWIHEDWMGRDRACHRLIYMQGATVVPGRFIRNKIYANMDWTDYWKRPPEYFK